MDSDEIKRLLRDVSKGTVSVSKAVSRLRDLPFEDLGFARVDHHRALRRGFPEVIFGDGKTPRQCAAIAGRIAKHGQPVLVTRSRLEHFEAVAKILPKAQWHEEARLISWRPGGGRLGPQSATAQGKGSSRSRASRAGARKGSGAEDVLIVTAGTSDIPVAEEAALTAEMMGARVGRFYDVGVAGIHRLLSGRKRLESARVIVVVAGMEGALPSVVAGMVRVPIVGVPTSVGYGAALGGLTALFGMLTSCAAGLTVVNIDNGFGAGYAAAVIAGAAGNK